jgi:hypothetical protein
MATRDDAYREAILAMQRSNRGVEEFKMVREEALTYTAAWPNQIWPPC